MKKILKNPDTTIFTLKNTLGPGTGAVPEFFLHFFHGLYLCFLVLKKILVGNQLCFSRFCPIKSSFNDISYLDIDDNFLNSIMT